MSTATPSTFVDDACFDRACQWFIDLREQPQSAELISEWLAWCRADARNRAAFERARAVWQSTAEAGLLLLPSADGAGDAGDARSVVASGARSPALRSWAVAASLAVLAVVVSALVPRLLTHGPGTALATRLGENRTLDLADGSTVALGADSRLIAHFDATARQLILERGEAYFRVKRDSSRPFVVLAGDLRVTAIGTAFNVRTAPHRIVVAVAEGTVAIDPPGAAPQESLRATAGQEVSIDSADGRVHLGRIEPAAVASWKAGRLEFTREPLRDVLSSINRYSPHRVRLGDPQLGELRFTGTVFADRVDDWLNALPRIFPVEVAGTSDGVIVVSAAR